jgi:hypothetical protein
MTGQCFVSCQLDPLSWPSPSLNPTSSSSTAPPPRSLVLVCSVRVSVYALQVPIRKHPSGEPRYGLCQRLYSLTTISISKSAPIQVPPNSTISTHVSAPTQAQSSSTISNSMGNSSGAPPNSNKSTHVDTSMHVLQFKRPATAAYPHTILMVQRHLRTELQVDLSVGHWKQARRAAGCICQKTLRAEMAMKHVSDDCEAP